MGLLLMSRKRFIQKFVVDAGYTDIHNLVLNSDRYGPARRVFVNTKIPSASSSAS